MANLKSLSIDNKTMSDFVVSRNNYFNIDNDGRYWTVTNWVSGFVEIDAKINVQPTDSEWTSFTNDRKYASYGFALPEKVTNIITVVGSCSGHLSYLGNLWTNDNNVYFAIVNWYNTSDTIYPVNIHITGYK